MKTLLLWFALLAAGASIGICAGVKFPSKDMCASPDLQWKIHCATQKQTDGYLHRVMLTRRAVSIGECIFEANRSCDVLWRPDSRALAITDWSGSSTAEIYLVEVSQPSKAIPLVVTDVERFIQKRELEGHCYYEALEWKSSHTLLIRVFGHTDENPSHEFTYFLSVETNSGEAKLVRAKIDY